LPFIFFNIVAYGEGQVIGRGKKTVQRKKKNLTSIIKKWISPSHIQNFEESTEEAVVR